MGSLLRRVMVAGAVLVVPLALAGCGGGEQRVALAIHEAERPDGIVVLHVECADDVEVQLSPDPSGSALPQVTVWGDPVVGRCDRKARVSGRDLPGDAFVDGATSQVVTIAG